MSISKPLRNRQFEGFGGSWSLGIQSISLLLRQSKLICEILIQKRSPSRLPYTFIESTSTLTTKL